MSPHIPIHVVLLLYLEGIVSRKLRSKHDQDKIIYPHPSLTHLLHIQRDGSALRKSTWNKFWMVQSGEFSENFHFHITASMWYVQAFCLSKQNLENDYSKNYQKHIHTTIIHNAFRYFEPNNLGGKGTIIFYCLIIHLS